MRATTGATTSPRAPTCYQAPTMEPDTRVDEIRHHVERRPFRPFRLHISDGNVHAVTDPDLVLVTRHTIVLGVRLSGEVIPDHAHYYDPMHITCVESMAEPPAA